MESLEIRDRRYRTQQQIEALDPEKDDGEIKALEAEIEKLREICPHEHREQDEDEGLWRCRDCDLRGSLETVASGSEGADDAVEASEAASA